MSFLGLENKCFLIQGIANKKSVAYFVAKTLEAEGAKVILAVRSKERKEQITKLFPDTDIYICEAEEAGAPEKLVKEISKKHKQIDGYLHSIAFANYSEGLKPFHETLKKDFLQALDISCFSLINTSNALKELFSKEASVVTVSISTTRMAAENYGYMGPIKAALDSAVVFLAKSFSAFSEVRFNSINPGLLKTSASAGIPGYVESYLFAEEATLRKRALSTQEAANAAVFLLSNCSSGINAQSLVLDAGMSVNYFDKEIIKKATK